VIHIIVKAVLESGFDLLESIIRIYWVPKIVVEANEVSNWYLFDLI